LRSGQHVARHHRRELVHAGHRAAVGPRAPRV
jgi:hypothetical protein